MTAEAVAPRKPSSVSPMDIGPLQVWRSWRYCFEACSSRTRLMAAASSFSGGTTSLTSPILNAGPGEEQARLAGDDDQPGQVGARRERVEMGRQLVERASRENVGPLARHVERQEGDVRLGKREHNGLGHGAKILVRRAWTLFAF